MFLIFREKIILSTTKMSLKKSTTKMYLLKMLNFY